MKVLVVLICCALIIIGLTYRGVGAYLRDRARSAERRAGRGDGGPPVVP